MSAVIFSSGVAATWAAACCRSGTRSPTAVCASVSAEEICRSPSNPGKSDGEAWLKLAILRQDAAQYRDAERAYKRAITLLKPGDRATLADALDHMRTMYRDSFAKYFLTMTTDC
jgi:hypothetical protein